MKIVAISDTHGMHRSVDQIPSCDVLIHAGDLCKYGTLTEIDDFINWIQLQPAQYIIIVAGNHDGPFQMDRALAESKVRLERIFYLRDGFVTLNNMKFYGSPWQPEFCNWFFNLPRNGEALENCWEQIPDDIDVLITHGPPNGILDMNDRGVLCGCEKLRLRLEKVKPKIHVFGHIHHSYGQLQVDSTIFVNASILNESYQVSNVPIVIDV